jgi:hypothetical protein
MQFLFRLLLLHPINKLYHTVTSEHKISAINKLDMAAYTVNCKSFILNVVGKIQY